MSFRRRLALSCGAAVAIVVVLGSVLAYFVVRDTLRGEIDAALRRQVADDRAGRAAGRATQGPVDQLMLLTGEAPVYVQTVRGKVERRPRTGPRRVPPPLADDADLQAVARGEKEPFFADRTIEGVARAGARDPLADRTARSSPRARWPRSTTRSGACAGRSALLAVAGHRARGAALPAGDAHRGAPGGGADDDRRARRLHARPHAPHRRARRRRGLAPGDRVQHDARRARGVPEGAAPARRRRLARAANAAHLAAHEPRGARPRRLARPRRTASACARTS